MEDSLVATRARRPNAGSRLKLLIEMEERASGPQTMIYTEDDENVQLLFQEDENDGEFKESDNEESQEEDEEGEDEEEQGENEEEAEKEDKSENEEDLDTQGDAKVNSDDMLSDSDLSESDDDESEGERELQKQSHKRKKKTVIPSIKKHRPAPKPQKPKVNYSEILQSERRVSLRKLAVRNKQHLLEKLKEDETRRAALAPVVRVKERELTQEERLAQAKETERDNVISLNMFLQQEIVKKERQKLLFQQRRPKLRNVIRLLSAETFVTPLDEVEDARHVQDLFERRKRGRRRKNYMDETGLRRPGDIDVELPYYQREMAERRRIEAIQAEERRRLEEARAIKRMKLEQERAERKRILEEERLARKKLKEQRLREYKDVDITSELKRNKEGDKQEEEGEDMEKQEEENAEKDDKEKEEEGQIEKKSDEQKELDDLVIEENALKDTENTKSDDINKEVSVKKEDDGRIEKLVIVDSPEPDQSKQDIEMENAENKTETKDKKMKEDIEMENEQNKEDTKTNDEEEKGEDENPDVEGTIKTEDKAEKKVTFADEAKEEPQETETETRSLTPIYRRQADGTVFEGPVQHVARNLVFLLNFDEEERWGLTDMRIKSVLFGEDANLGGSRRFQDLRTILKSSIRLDNPYASQKEESDDELFNPVSKITEESLMFESLNKLPRFGDKDIYEEEIEIENMEDTSEIRIRTDAPSGLFLPNGNKKVCLISGKEVRYFDPATGLSYGSKEMYQTIKLVELGAFPWLSIGKDQNTYGAVEIYLNQREGRHAQGVPEGFDGE